MDEQQRLEVLHQIDRKKGLRNRNKRGQFATPATLAQEIVDAALSWLGESDSIHYLEPGFGTSPFFASLHRMARDRIASAVGYEIDPDYADAAARLYANTCLTLHRQDFLLADPPASEAGRFNLVISNPPYVRHHHLSQEQKYRFREVIKARTSFQLSGLSGLYAYFLLGSRAWMSRDGIGVWLIPSEFMDVNYGRQVKEFLCSQVQLLRIHRFPPAALQFDDALVTSAVIFFRNAPPKAAVELSEGRTLHAPDTIEKVDLSEMRNLAKWTTRFSRSRFTSRTIQPETVLSDWFQIKRGLATGSNSFFVMTPQEAAARSLPRQFLQPLLPSPRKLEADLIPTDGEGMPQVREPRFLLMCHLPEEEIERTYPTLWAYLEEGRKQGVHRGYLCSHRVPWYCQEHRPAAPFLCTYMARAKSQERMPFRFVVNRSQATATNVYLMLYPKPPLQIHLDRKECLIEVWQALRSITSDSIHREGRVYGGGLHKLEPKELGSVDASAIREWIKNKQNEL